MSAEAQQVPKLPPTRSRKVSRVCFLFEFFFIELKKS